MQLVTWSDDYSVGNEQLDTQHKSLFELLNKLHDGITDKRENQYNDEILLELQHYAVMHLSFEEIHMADILYDDLDKHMAQHDILRAKVGELSSTNSIGGPDRQKELVEFLSEWLLKHVINEDKKYSRH